MRGASSRASRRRAFPDRPARGGSTTTTSGCPARSRSSSSDSATSPAKNAAFAIPFSSAFSSAHATDSSEASTPHTVNAPRAIVSPIVPIPQYRS
jgi:hypothetical protein